MIIAQAHTPSRTTSGPSLTPAQVRWEAFATAQPDRALWINVNRDSNSFAASLHDVLRQRSILATRRDGDAASSATPRVDQ